jgi:hypothetical protein
MKHNIGEQVTVISNESNHRIPIGEKVQILSINFLGYSVQYCGIRWILSEEEVL